MLRVAKPGAFLLCFGGSRTFHRMACNIEDAGWEIRDTIMWLYGSGFPKSYNISKGIDKHFKTERKVVGIDKNKIARNPNGKGRRGAACSIGDMKKQLKSGNTKTEDGRCLKKALALAEKQKENNILGEITIPATEQAQLWDGYGTAMKPSYEPIIVAMKPIDKNFVNNALTHGVAGLNIDGCRINHNEKQRFVFRGERREESTYKYNQENPSSSDNGMFRSGQIQGEGSASPSPKGRFPANIILDHEAAELLDEQSAPNMHSAGKKRSGGLGKEENNKSIFNGHNENNGSRFGDSGGASRFFQKCDFTEEDDITRFFYTAKASRKERNAGCEELEEKQANKNGSGLGRKCSLKKRINEKGDDLIRSKNTHPTVKPLALLEYLCNLTRTPTGGIVLDPYAGSGTTGCACVNTDRDFIGIELEEDYVEIAKKRIEYYENKRKEKLFP